MFLPTAMFQNATVWMQLCQKQSQMMMQANVVIAQRVTQMVLGTMTPREATRMVFEKPVAFATSAQKTAQALAASQGYAAASLAGLAPIGAKTKTNARRLTRQR
ncbi:MAG: hypothetical protein V2J13_10970 [Cycloclasticus sp.]|jgi:hypothetical protein|nr:hypothetical protein [Cycloclasticus sp.]